MNRKTRFNEVAQFEDYSEESDPDETKKRDGNMRLKSTQSITNLKASPTKSLKNYVEENSEESDNRKFSEEDDNGRAEKVNRGSGGHNRQRSRLPMLDQTDSDYSDSEDRKNKYGRVATNSSNMPIKNTMIKGAMRDDISHKSDVSDVNLDNLNDPYERELHMLAKIKLYKSKLGRKNELINTLKESIDSDIKLKQTLEQKINDLKGRLLDNKQTPQTNHLDDNRIYNHNIQTIYSIDMRKIQINQLIIRVDYCLNIC
jgi:hypothetical protein